MLNLEYAEKLGWQNREPEEFEDAEVCEFVAGVLLYTHKQHKKRVAKGHHVNVDRLSASLKNKKLKNMICSLFARKKKS